MRYFEKKIYISGFIKSALLDRKKSIQYMFMPERDEIYLKYSPKKYKSIDEIIDEIEQNGYLFELKKFVGGGSENFSDFGFILLYTQLINTLKKNEGIISEMSFFKLLTINQTCEMLQITRPSLNKLINNGELPYVEIFSQKKIQVKDILDFIQRNKFKKATSK